MDCPTIYDPQRFTVKIRSRKNFTDSVFQLECRARAQDINLSLIEDCNFSSIKYVEFKFCPLLNISFGELLNRIGIQPENITTLSFVYYGRRQRVSLQEWHLEGLSNLKNLEFKENNFTSIPARLFDSTPNLRYLSFTGNDMETLPESLFASVPNLTEAFLRTNKFSSIPDNLFANVSKLTNLSMWGNNLETIQPKLLSNVPKLRLFEISHNKISQLDSDVFSNLPDLRVLILNSNLLEFLPEQIFHSCPDLENLKLNENKIRSLSAGLFRESKNMKELDISNNLITSFPENIFMGMGNLLKLKLKRNGLKSLPTDVFSDLTNLKVLDLQSNILEALPPGCFDNQRNVDILILKNNSLTELPDNIFKNCEQLEKLYLSYNNIHTLHSSSFPHPKTVLQVLELDNNNITFSSSKKDPLYGQDLITLEKHFPLSDQRNLTELHLNNNRITAIPQAFGTNFPNLAKLYFNGNYIDYVDNNDFSFKSPNIFVDLRNNKIKVVSLSDMKDTPQRIVEISLKGNPMICNCHLYHFSRLLQRTLFEEQTYTFQLYVREKEKLTCTYPDEQNVPHTIMEVNKQSLTCQLEDCPTRCTCSDRPFDKMFIIDCASQGLKTIPKLRDDQLPRENYSITLNLNNNSIMNLDGLKDPSYSALVNLTIPNNRLSFFNETKFSDKFQALDIRGNNLTSLPKSLLEFLNSTDAILSLGENPWLCNCDLSDLHTFLRDPNRKVTDSSNILCHNLQELIINLTDADLCPIIEQPVVIATITCSSIFLFLFFVFGTVSIYRYKQDMKVWLFTHRICLWAVAEEEQEANKKYDAFISYSNKDEEFVNTVLVPGLESGDPKYRVCLHYRDWVPGDYIQNQIDQSIEASRRTIVILSSNFIENVWGQLEFKTAHSKALKDKTNRIIVIVFGELPPESELDEELKLYLSTRTYLQWRDTKFWDKLRYAMPHPQEFIHKKQKRKNTEKLELVKSNSKQCA